VRRCVQPERERVPTRVREKSAKCVPRRERRGRTSGLRAAGPRRERHGRAACVPRVSPCVVGGGRPAWPTPLSLWCGGNAARVAESPLRVLWGERGLRGRLLSPCVVGGARPAWPAPLCTASSSLCPCVEGVECTVPLVVGGVEYLSCVRGQPARARVRAPAHHTHLCRVEERLRALHVRVQRHVSVPPCVCKSACARARVRSYATRPTEDKGGKSASERCTCVQ
jgi:hypothetical protein